MGSSTRRWTVQDRERVARLWCGVIGAAIAAQGLWAFVSPRGFYDVLAVFEPFNHHFIRDIGSMQMGIGIAAVVAARKATGLVVGLTALTAFQVLHVLSHVIDRDDGGRPAFDIAALGSAAALTVVALVFAVRPERRRA
jgi:hypothetical protein